MESPLAKKYRLTALDLPGHGMSAHAEDPKTTYSMSGLVGIISEFAERVGLRDSVFVGWSLGGNLLVEATELLSSAKGLMLIGTFLPSKTLNMELMAYPHPALASLFKADLTDEELNTFASALMKPGGVPPLFLREDIRNSDSRLRAVLGDAIAQGRHKDEVSIVAGLQTPLAVVLGAEDQLCRESYMRNLRMPSLWRGDLQIIPDAGHIPQWEQSERFNGILEEFITESAKNKKPE